MNLADILVFCGIGTLETIHLLRIFGAASTGTGTGSWILWIVYAGVVGVLLTVEALLSMLKYNPDMKLGIPIVIAAYIAHVFIMYTMPRGTGASAHFARYLDAALICTWILALAEYRWGICTAIGGLVG